MAGVNKVILIGNLGADPEVRTTPQGAMVANLRLAVSETWKDQQGQRQERTEWVNLVLWRQQAEIAQKYLRKGSRVYVEGKLQTRSWDDAQGVRHWRTEIVANHVEMLAGRRRRDYSAEVAAESLEAQALAAGIEPDPLEPAAESFVPAGPGEPVDDEDEEDELLEEAVAA